MTNSAQEEFFSECQEILDRVSGSLTVIEQNQHTQGTMDSLYREMHTLKGTSQLFGYQLIGKIAHAMETALEPLRKRPGAKIGSDFLNTVNLALELIEKLYKNLRAGGTEETFQIQFDEVLSSLVNWTLRDYEREQGSKLGIGEGILPSSHEALIAMLPVPPLKNQAETLPMTSIPEVEAHCVPKVESTELESPPSVTPPPVSTGVTPNATPSLTGTVTPPAAATSTATPPAAAELAGSTDSTIRVPVQLLDKLMNLVGELVLVRNQMIQHSSASEDLEFLALSQNLNTVTSDLQAEVMKTRMQPIGAIFGKFQRVVRDIAHQLAKKIEVSIQGAETELDKTLLEAIKDPLTHIIRNSCDHGLENPEQRKLAGKGEAGRITIRAYHEGGQVVVQISDDGRGLNDKKIIAKAIEKNLITREQADRMNEREISNLIFLPSFSTAETVTDVSGRGVGMDVVKTNIEKIGGTIDLESQLGKGMTIRLKIPLTLAIIPAMIVRSNQERFAIPQVKLVQLVRVEKGSEGAPQVEMLQGKPVFRLRGRLLPLISLKEILGDLSSLEAEKAVNDLDIINIVVLTSENGQFGLIVDQILDAGDIVVKPLSPFIKALDTFSGATIMGDGSVALILDISGVSKRVIGSAENHAETRLESGSEFHSTAPGNVRDKRPDEAQEFLLFATDAPGKYALPLCLVHRLEEFPSDQVEISGTRRVMRYRDSIMQLIPLNQSLNLKPIASKSKSTEASIPNQASINPEETSKISVIVVQKNGKNYGIEVNAILDVVYITETIDDSVRDRPGILGSTVYNSEVIVVVDILTIMDNEFHPIGASATPMATHSPQPEKKSKTLNILLAEDTPFFRKQIKKMLEKSGHQVTTAEDGQKALKILEEAHEQPFDLILSDIEMPNLNGFQLAQAIRNMDRYKKIPLVAVTSKFQQRDKDEGIRSGFDRYLEKLNEEVLMSEIAKLI